MTQAYGTITVVDTTDGINSATIYLYQRSASTPSKPSGDITYTFATKSLSGSLGNWVTSIPTGTDPCYVIAATAVGNTPTDVIASSEWSNPIQFNGSNGTTGFNQATIFLYQRAASQPNKPSSAVTYTFSNGNLNTIPSGWSRTIPTADGNPCWVTTAVAISQSSSVSIATTAWANITKLVEDGDNAVGYTLGVSHASVFMNQDGTCNPSSITFDSKKADGDSISAYAGKFKIETSSDNTNWTTAYQTANNTTESSTTFTTPTAIEDKVPYNYRATGGGLSVGSRVNEKIVGGTVNWNQLIKNGNFANNTTNWTLTGSIIASVSNNILSVTASASGDYYMNQGLPLIINHKYLASVTAKDENATSKVCTYIFFGEPSNYKILYTSNQWKTSSTIFNCVTNTHNGFRLFNGVANSTTQFKNVQVFDLTQMFGSTIADYIYSLETATAGAGVAWFRNLFSNDFYQYNPGELMSVQTSSHNTIGFNHFTTDKLILNDTHIIINTDNSIIVNQTAYQELTNSYPVVKINKAFHFEADVETISANNANSGFKVYMYYTDGSVDTTNNILLGNAGNAQHISCTSRSDKILDHYSIGGWAYGGSVKLSNICISYNSSRNGEYEPYNKHSYSLDSSLTLNGIPKLDTNNILYYDGDIYSSDGNVNKRYKLVIINGDNTYTYQANGVVTGVTSKCYIAFADKAYGQYNIFSNKFTTRTGENPYTMTGRSATNGVEFNLPINVENTPAALKAWFVNNPTVFLYELATPTTEQANPFINPQIVDPYGTEEYVDYPCSQDDRDVSIPVGHESNYISNIKSIRTSLYLADGTTLVDQKTIPVVTNEDNTSSLYDTVMTVLNNSVGTTEAPYTQVEWVESTGKQYVYLDWKPRIEDWGFEADFISYNALNTSEAAWREDTNKNNAGAIFGTRNASGVNNVELNSYSNGLLSVGTNWYRGNISFKTDNTRQSFKLHGTTLTKPDGTTMTVTRNTETANKPYCNMTVFAYHDGVRRRDTGYLRYPGSVRIYSLKFYDGTTLAVDLVGAIRKTDNVTGLYDKISQHFYPASGMLYGNAVRDIGHVDTINETIIKSNPQTIVVNKNNSRMWEASVPFDRLDDGQKLTVTYTYSISGSVETTKLAGWDDTDSNSRVYLQLTFNNGNTTDWIPCYYSNTNRLTTHYGAGIPINFTYREDILANTTATAAGSMVMRGFFADANYDSNQTNHILNNFSGKTGSVGLWATSLLMKDGNGTYQNICTAANGTCTSDNRTVATTKIANTNGFYIGSQIYYSDGNINANSNITSGIYASMGAFDSRYCINSTLTANFLVPYTPIYLTGTILNDGLYHLDTVWWTQTPNNTDKLYVLIGNVYDSTTSYCRISLTEPNPWYIYDGTKLVEYNVSLANKAMTAANSKNKVFHQSTAPAASVGLSVGDTWFDSDDGYKMYTWSGTTWAEEQFGENAIHDLAITNAKIANATIQSGKIANLDVGKLTGGYIDAGHIDVGTIISTNNLATTSDVNNIVETINQETISRGEQLVTNGNGMLGNNTNFSRLTFTGAEAYYSPGSFTKTETAYTNLQSDDWFPIDVNKRYRFEFDIKSLNNAGTFYSYLQFGDVDKREVTAGDTMWVANTLTTLTRDLVAGDTKVYLNDVTNYHTLGNGSSTNQRMLTFWNYTNNFGYTYPSQTYSKIHKYWTNDSSIDRTNNAITLTAAHTGTTIPAGTYVSQGNSGSTYKYIGLVGSKVPTTWTHYVGYMDGVDLSGTNASGKFPPGTAYAKVGFLWNYNSANDQFWITNIQVYEDYKTDIDNAIASVTTKSQYYLSTSTSSATGGSWADTIPTWTSGKYLWTRIVVTKTTTGGTSTTSYSPAEGGAYDKNLTTALSTASSAQTSANSAASTVVTTQQYYLSTSASSATGGSWQDSVPTWSSGKYIWTRLKIVKTPVSGSATTSYSPSESGVYDRTITDAKSYTDTVTSDMATNTSIANTYATKANTVKRTQRIYYRKSASGAPSTPGTASSNWVTTSTDVFGQWTKKIPRLTANADGTGTKYLYLYTCEQYELASGTVGYTDVLLDDSTTIIDGGNIVTGTIDANVVNVTNLDATEIRSGTIVADRIQVGSVDITKLSTGVQMSIEQGEDAYIGVDTLNEMLADVSNQVDTVQQLVNQAQTSVNNAQEFANRAYNSATSAYNQLSQIEKVMDVLEWAAEHGTYTATTDTQVMNGKNYFQYNSATDKYDYVVTPASNPATAGYYELTGTDASISRYILSHLALTDDGLFVQVDNQSTRLQLDGEGIYLWSSEGCIASYSSEVTLGLENDVHLVLSPTNGLQFFEGNNRVAWITSNVLHIDQAEITNLLRIGQFIWKTYDSNRISLVYAPTSSS